MSDPEELLLPGEVAAMFRVSASTVSRWAKDGKLPSFRTPAGQARFHRADIERLIAETTNGPAERNPAYTGPRYAATE